MASRIFSCIRQAFSPLSTVPRRAFRPLPPERPLDSQKGVLEFLDAHGGGAGAARNGRSWRTAELRLKSYEDLHKLWFILLKERNVLFTEKAWCKTNKRHWENGASNLYKVRRSMQRIKTVIGERVRASRAMKARFALQGEMRGNSKRDIEAGCGDTAVSVDGKDATVEPKGI